MAWASQKSLAVSLALHAVVFSAGGWTLMRVMPTLRVQQVDGPAIVLPGDADPRVPAVPQIFGEVRPEPLPPPRGLPKLQTNDWPARSVANVAIERTIVDAPLTWHRMQLGTLRAHQPVGSGAGGQANMPIIGTGSGGEGGTLNGGASGGASSESANVASLVTGAGGGIGTSNASGGGSLWGSGGPIPLTGNAAPVYPTLQKRRGIGGIVRLTLTVSESGTVQAAVVAQSSGSAALDAAAVAAVRKWRFKPVGTGPSVASVTQEIRFDVE